MQKHIIGVILSSILLVSCGTEPLPGEHTADFNQQALPPAGSPRPTESRPTPFTTASGPPRIHAAAPPATSTWLTVTPGIGTLTASWPASRDVRRLVLRPEGHVKLFEPGDSVTSHTFTNLLSQRSYIVHARVRGGGAVAQVGPISPSAPPVITPALGQVQRLRIGRGTGKLRWRPVDGAEGYYLYVTRAGSRPPCPSDPLVPACSTASRLLDPGVHLNQFGQYEVSVMALRGAPWAALQRNEQVRRRDLGTDWGRRSAAVTVRQHRPVSAVKILRFEDVSSSSIRLYVQPLPADTFVAEYHVAVASISGNSGDRLRLQRDGSGSYFLVERIDRSRPARVYVRPVDPRNPEPGRTPSTDRSHFEIPAAR